MDKWLRSEYIIEMGFRALGLELGLRLECQGDLVILENRMETTLYYLGVKGLGSRGLRKYVTIMGRIRVTVRLVGVIHLLTKSP